jgi:hypothetical protein
VVLVLLRLGLVAAGLERGRAIIDGTAADASELFEVAAVLVEGRLEMSAAGCVGVVAARAMLVRVT